MPAPTWTGRPTATSDYTDYTDAYEAYKYIIATAASSTICNYLDSAGNIDRSAQHILGTDHFRKLSQELRIATPADKPLRAIVGAFYQRQSNHIFQDYLVDNLAPTCRSTAVPARSG